MEKNFDEKRENFLKKINDKRGSSEITLTEKEERVNKKLLAMVQNIKDDENINLLDDLFTLKEDLKKSKLFKNLKKMPKGVINHLHLPAAFSLKKFKEICCDKRVYINPKNNSLKVFIEEKKIEKDYIQFTKYKKEIGEKKAKEIINNLILLTQDEFKKKDDKCIFECFGLKFDPLLIALYEPFLKLLFEDMINLLNEDNVQGVELRHVFNYNKTSKNEIQTINGELNFFQNLKKISSKKSSIKISFILTTIKILGEDHFSDLLNFYKTSLNTHPGLINGFDMVHYEDSAHIISFKNRLLKEKKNEPRINFFFHAGETVNKDNNNVLDAILLGTKRIGHGLAIQTSPILIDLVKEFDICVEINPLSNYLLGYVRDLRWHPAKFLINCGVRISISPDDYLIFGEQGVTMDFFLAFLYWEFDLRDVKWCLYNSIQWSSFCEEVRNGILVEFEEKWKEFIEEMDN